MANIVKGTVATIDPHGRLITDIKLDRVAAAPRDETLVIKFGGHETFGLFDADHQQPESTMVASRGHSGQIEIEIVGMNLSEMLGIPAGTQVELKW